MPVCGGYRVQFAGGRATVPDEVADTLVAIGGGFYTFAGVDLSLIEAGRHVLVIRDMGLGDMLLITPLLRALSARGILVDVQTLSRYQPLFDGNPSVRRTFSLEEEAPLAEDYDFLLDLRLFVENEEAAGQRRHRIDGFASAADVVIGQGTAARKLDYFVLPAEEAVANARLKKIKRSVSGGRGVIGYVWRASAENRSWSAQTHQRMLAALVLAGWGVVLLDHEPQAPDLIGSTLLNLSGQLSIRETAGVMSACDVILTPDTGLFHMAGAVGVPTVAYFGPFPAAERQAHKTLTVLDTRENCGLLPCRSYRCLNRGEDAQSRCLELSPSQVITALMQSISQGIK